jgi:hypothetical protein
MTEQVDFVSPMVYPSHYAKGEYRITDPNKAPYKTVFLGLEGAKRRLGEASPKLRPYLQDFSLGYHYGAKEVRDQIQASYDNDIAEWLLWNPRCVYTRAALKSKDFETAYNKNAVLPIQPAKTVKSGIETSSGTPAGHAPVAETSSFKKETGTGQETNQAGTAELKKILSPQTTTNNK